MKEKIGGILFTIIVIVQTILHYLGWLGIILGVIALLFKNTGRGTELIIGGISFIVIKYVIGFVFHLLVGSFKKKNNL